MPTNPAWVEHTERAAWDTVAALRKEVERERNQLERLLQLEPSLPKLATLLEAAKAEHRLETKDAAETVERLIEKLKQLERERDALRAELERERGQADRVSQRSRAKR